MPGEALPDVLGSAARGDAGRHRLEVGAGRADGVVHGHSATLRSRPSFGSGRSSRSRATPRMIAPNCWCSRVQIRMQPAWCRFASCPLAQQRREVARVPGEKDACKTVEISSQSAVAACAPLAATTGRCRRVRCRGPKCRPLRGLRPPRRPSVRKLRTGCTETPECSRQVSCHWRATTSCKVWPFGALSVTWKRSVTSKSATTTQVMR